MTNNEFANIDDILQSSDEEIDIDDYEEIDIDDLLQTSDDEIDIDDLLKSSDNESNDKNEVCILSL